MDGWMIEWLDGQAIFFFVELLLHWATSLLRHLFSQLRLLWTATCLGHFCSELPPSCLFCSFCNPVLLFARLLQCAWATSSCNPACQEPGARQHHWCFAARSRANAFCHNRLHTRIAGASHQIDQCARSADNGDDVALLWTYQFFTNFTTNRALLQSCALLSTTFPHRGPNPRKQRPDSGDPTSHLTRKNTGFRARECFHPWSHAFRNCCSSLLLPHTNCSCSKCCWHDDDMTTRLPLDIHP